MPALAWFLKLDIFPNAKPLYSVYWEHFPIPSALLSSPCILISFTKLLRNTGMSRKGPRWLKCFTAAPLTSNLIEKCFGFINMGFMDRNYHFLLFRSAKPQLSCWSVLLPAACSAFLSKTLYFTVQPTGKDEMYVCFSKGPV